MSLEKNHVYISILNRLNKIYSQMFSDNRLTML